MNPKPKRHEGWEQRLSEYIASKVGVPFAWGSHDCCTFAAGALLALTGENPMFSHGEYTDAAGAAIVLRDAGGIERIPEAHGLSLLPSVSFAMRGDIVSIKIDGRTSLGVCCGNISLFAGPVGLASKNTADCLNAWRVE